jgi:Rod binding domain-containing protein
VANASTDIVLGVALAADPEKYRVAAERLRGMSAELSAARSADFQAFVASVEEARTGAADTAPSALATPTPRVASLPARRPHSADDAFAQLEAFVLQTFIQSMLPKNASNVFGKGSAGEIWKSMLAEKLGHEVARSGQLGIAARLMSASAAGAFSVAQGSPRQVGGGDEADPSQPSTSLEQS